MKRIINLFGLLLLTLLAAGCNSNDKSQAIDKIDGFDYGHVENDKYINTFFDFELKIPSGWFVQNKEQIENMTQKGKDIVAGDDKNLKAIIKASEVNSATLLAAFQYEAGSAVEFNPSIMIVAENLKNLPGIKTGNDYLFNSRKLLKLSKLEYDYIDEEFKKTVISNHDFYSMNATMKISGMSVRQVYYATIQNGFGIGVVITFLNDEQKIQLEGVVNSIEFGK